MGKNLKGKELGKGFYQRKDGRYEAKVMIKGRKIDLYDWDLKNLKRRMAEEKEKYECSYYVQRKGLTLNDWFEEWFEIYKRPVIKETTVPV